MTWMLQGSMLQQGCCLVLLLVLAAAAASAKDLLQDGQLASFAAQSQSAVQPWPYNHYIMNTPPFFTPEEAEKATINLKQTLAAPQAAAAQGPERQAAAAAAVSPAAITAKDQKVLLDTHNKHRANHQAPPLVWNTALAAAAEVYAQKCIWAHEGVRDMGENLFATSRKDNTTAAAEGAMAGWYNEVGLYQQANPAYGTNPVFVPAAGHFTQVVWKASTALGCAVQLCDNLQNVGWGGLYIVCRYAPPGNVLGSFEANVLAPLVPPVIDEPEDPNQPPAPTGPTFAASAAMPAGTGIKSGFGCLYCAKRTYSLCVTGAGAAVVAHEATKKTAWSSNTVILPQNMPAMFGILKDGSILLADRTYASTFKPVKQVRRACTTCIAPQRSALILTDGGQLALYDNCVIAGTKIRCDKRIWATRRPQQP